MLTFKSLFGACAKGTAESLTLIGCADDASGGAAVGRDPRAVGCHGDARERRVDALWCEVGVTLFLYGAAHVHPLPRRD